MHSLSELLGDHGPFAQLVEGFAPRIQQQQMAEAVADALTNEQVLVAEAGTGTGKTFAYLVPALLSGQKVIISTGTKNLQDQLFHKDLPIVRKALGVPVELALLKGRANYLCPHRLELSLSEGHFISRKQASNIQSISRWAETTQSGDIAELSSLPEDAPEWPIVTSTPDNCLGMECDRIDDCFLVKARRKAQEADVLVVNHHLLFADMALRDEGFGELLPGANAFILDEAHQLPETASSFFGITVSGNQLLELARDSIAEEIKEAGEQPDLHRSADQLQKAVRDLRLAMGTALRRGRWQEIAANGDLDTAIDDLSEQLTELSTILEPLAVRGKGLDNCYRRCRELSDRFESLTANPPEGYIHWYETHTRSFTINLTPMDVAKVFRQQVDMHKRAWILTSATLAVGDSFNHFISRLGLDEAHCEQWDSPFDFATQTLFYVPQGMPDPREATYTQSVVEQALPVLKASQGRAFLLFTSHRALKEAAEHLEGQIDYPILIQGEAPRPQLLERFRELGNAVLLGTGSFWEGVDVRGEALSCVIIDKLPFASPGDPILQARIDVLRERGGNPFMEYQLPQAVITLKQGVGRLIRDVNDRGVMMICDPRLIDKSYGKVFLESLPPMSRTRSLKKVQHFFEIEPEL